MDVKSTDFHLYDYKQSDQMMMVEEKNLLMQLQAEAEMCSRKEHTADEVTAAIGMILMHYQVFSEVQFTPKNKHITLTTTSTAKQTPRIQSLAKSNSSLHGIQRHVEMKHQIRKTRKSNSSKSSLLASCRNILKEFLSQNSM
ncbi:uncharacterized protein LOC142227344 [Haematobia irritans]|uniref:uncharacterized protein LOC142227344 n=1 Tax=Haematobia irritans TaxID=7368 RepID=UPI003F5048F5